MGLNDPTGLSEAMPPGFPFDPGALPQYLAVAGMLGLAATLLVLDIESRLNRAFAFVLVFRGMSMLTATQWQIARFEDPVTSAFWVKLFPYFTIATAPAIAYFIWVYPRPRRRVKPGWLPAAVIVGLVVALEAAYVLDPSLWGTYAISSEGTLVTVTQGPMQALLGLIFVMFGVAGLAFAHDATRAPAGPERRSLLLVSLAFTVNALYDGTGGALIVLGALDFEVTGIGLPQYLGALSLLIALAAPALVALHAARRGDARWRRHARRYGAICVLPVALSAGSLFLSEYWNFFIATGLLRLSLPVLVSYALLRHQLFDIDLKVRWGLEKGTVGAVFAAAFVFASEGIEVLLPVEGTLLGIVAAGSLALALRPIERAAEDMAARVMPNSKPVSQLDEEEGLELYRQQCRIAWSNDEVTGKERAALDNLRARLGLDDELAERIEAEARGGDEVGDATAAAAG